MKILYVDCFAGVSGDMFLGALVDAGVPIEQLQTELARLNLDGFTLHAEKCLKNGISGTKVNVRTEEQKAHRHLKHIHEIIENSSHDDSIKTISLQVFQTLAEAEAKIHNTSPEKIHFHEVGALDAIVDVVGAVIGLHLLGVDQVIASPVHVGTGFVDCQHGRLPVPAPATIEILRGVPVYSTGLDAELITPTGAAILKTVATGFGPMPAMSLERIGYGAGSRDLPIPNLLRVILGSAAGDGYELDQVDMIESNIDNMSPEHFDYLIERLMSSGALDATLTPLIMKKSRPAVCLSVIASPGDTSKLLDLVFRETTTLGVRVQRVGRRKLPREVRKVGTKYGFISVKESRLNGEVRNIAPEYEDCAKAAREHDAPLSDVYSEAVRAARENPAIMSDERKEQDEK